ncbi:hypothetical protein DFS34DRAFT_691882 [Phlyctochytrium arcticum]|nr:hypothetical protein DFS34DRAFT_691882 [Phlyctochytrium arcticum]
MMLWAPSQWLQMSLTSRQTITQCLWTTDALRRREPQDAHELTSVGEQLFPSDVNQNVEDETNIEDEPPSSRALIDVAMRKFGELALSAGDQPAGAEPSLPTRVLMDVLHMMKHIVIRCRHGIGLKFIRALRGAFFLWTNPIRP